MLRFISAFLFALVLLCASFAGFWYMAHQRAYVRLVDIAKQQLGADLTYAQVVPVYDPTGIMFQLKNVRLERVDAQGGRVAHMLPQADVEMDFFSAYQIQIHLPHAQQLEVQQVNQPTERYSVAMQKGVLGVFPDDERVSLSFVSMGMKDDTGDVIRMGIGDIALQHADGGLEFDMLFKQPNINWVKDMGEMATSSFSLTGHLSEVDSIVDQVMMPLMQSRTVEKIRAWQALMLGQVVERDAVLTIEDMVWGKGKESVSIQAAVRLDMRQRLWGDIRITASAQRLFMDVLRKSFLLGDGALALNRSLQEVLQAQKQTPYIYDMRINRGTVITNGHRIGVAAPMAEMLRLELPSRERIEGDYGERPAGM